MQSPLDNPSDVWKQLPANHRRTIREKNFRVYFADTVSIAREVASEPDLQMRMQGIVTLGAFLKLTPYASNSGMSDDEVLQGVQKALQKYFGKRGEQVVKDNLTCVKRGFQEMQVIPPEQVEAE